MIKETKNVNKILFHFLEIAQAEIIELTPKSYLEEIVDEFYYRQWNTPFMEMNHF